MRCMFCEDRSADKECYFCHSLMCGECGELCTDCGIDICFGCMYMEDGYGYCADCPDEGWVDEEDLIAEIAEEMKYWDTIIEEGERDDS